MIFIRLLGSCLLVLTLSACLTTRSQLRQDIKERVNPKDQVDVIKEEKIDPVVRLTEMDAQFRELNGRIEVNERRLQLLNEEKKKELEEKKLDSLALADKLKIYEEALVKLEAELQAVKLEMVELKKPKKVEKPAKTVGNFSQAEEFFAKKKWKEAVVGFQKYRDLNPKGNKYGTATYKIGVCFQELGMKSEAKAFYEEVIEKYPKGRLAKKAQYRLKNMK